MSDILTALPNSSQVLDAINSQPIQGTKFQSGQGEKTLGQEEFFKLLTTQLASQDPLSPMDDTAFIAQMANFSELEMMSKLNNNFAKFTSLQQFQSAQGYIWKNLTMLVDGEDVSGLATGIEHLDGATRVFVGGSGYNIDTVYKVEQPEG